ncbi:MAG: hybrid sensor histidine kinase/response regulator [Prevotellaceae bacterium]|jgi:signal transduction histidine kinase/CheY-like chemotaxis protein|nr:hybrid sensor histidine kinase/response regulator [Prevotellaceae bacterium]
MKKSIEHKIRVKAVLGYLLVPVACVGMILYIHHLNTRIDRQKKNIERHNLVLSLTDELTASVQRAQSAANLFLFSNNSQYFRQLQELLPVVEQQVDSLIALSSDSVQPQMLRNVVFLLQKKKTSIAKLAEYFSRYSVNDTLVRWLQSYTPAVTTDSVIVTAVHQDTLVQAPEPEPEEPKNFWQKIGNMFSTPPPQKEVYNVVTTIQTSTLRNVAVDTLSMLSVLSGMRKMSEQNSESYVKKIKSIEHLVNRLVATDQEVSKDISELLIKLHRQTLDSTLAVINNNKQLVEKNYISSVAIGVALSLLVLVFIFLIIIDANKSYATRRALEDEQRRTKELMNSRHELLLSVSHDVKAPLTSMLGYLELWKDKELPPKRQQQLVSMQSSGTYILLLLTNLLDFSRLEQGKLQANYSAFDVQTLCREVEAMFAPLALQKGLAFRQRCELRDLACVASDRLKLKQIMVNLVSNAVKYTQKGEVALTVWEEDRRLRLCVADTGIGIPEAKIENLFKPFLRIDSGSSVAEGSGLGMYVVKGLTEILQGSVSVRSQEGQGTQVELVLPAEKASADAATLQEAPPTASTGKKLNVLVADDDASLLTMLEEMQHKLGNTVTTCRSIAELEALLPQLGSFDMVLTDMDMGATSGKDLLLKVREASPSIPVFVMTALGDFSYERAISEGFDGYLPKPFSMSLLAELPKKRAAGNAPNAPEQDSSKSGVAALLELFNGDREAVEDVLKVFVADAARNLALLRRLVAQNDFQSAQALCHKMLPMFAQLKLTDLVALPEKMSALRGKKPKHFPKWRKETLAFATEAEKQLKEIADVNAIKNLEKIKIL